MPSSWRRRPVAGSTSRVRHASSPHEATASRPSGAHRRSVANVRPCAASGGEARQQPHGASRRGSSGARRRGPRASRGRPGARTSRRRRRVPGSRRGSRTASSATVGRAATAGIDGAQARAGPVVIADQHDALDGTRRRTTRAGGRRCRARRPTTPSVSRCPASVPVESSTASSRYHATPVSGVVARRPAARHAGGSHGGSAAANAGGPGDARRAQQRHRGQGQDRTRESDHLHGGASSGGIRTGGRRARGPVSRRALTRHLSRSDPALEAAGWYTSARQRGPRAPAHPTRCGREAGASPAQSRYGDRPSGAEVRSPIRRRRSSLREKGQAHRAIHRLTPPSTPKRGVFHVPPLHPPASGAPVDARSRPTDRRRATPFAAFLLFLLATVMAACAAPAARPPRRRRRSRRPRRPPPATAAPTAAPTPTAGAGLPGHADRRRGHERHARRPSRRRSSR